MSVPDYTGNVTRAEHIVVEFTDRSGRVRVIEASGFEAVAIQHELDHLDGILLVDRMSPVKKVAIGGKLKRLVKETKQAL